MKIIEYIRKDDKKPNRNENGRIIVRGRGIGRQKKGVMYCRFDEKYDTVAVVGFSLCNSMDKFDYIKGVYEPGFGLAIAAERADKWFDYKGFFVQKTWSEKDLTEHWIKDKDLYIYENPDPKIIVEIPPSIYNRLTNFVTRCKKYFKDKPFPEWVDKLAEKKQVEGIDFMKKKL